MTCQLPYLIRAVRTAMGIDKADRQLIHCRDPDRADLDGMIAQHLVTAAAKAVADAPAAAVAECARVIDSSPIFWHEPIDGTYSGHIFLPDDFLRLLVFEMSDWSRPVVQPLTDDSPGRSAFFSPFASIAGDRHCPKCLITDTSEGHCLIFRSCLSDNASIVHARYIPRPAIDHGGMDIPSALLPDIITSAASALSNP